MMENNNIKEQNTSFGIVNIDFQMTCFQVSTVSDITTNLLYISAAE
jgi:hypothetical protein